MRNNPTAFLVVLFLCGPANAGLEGEYELVSGMSKCPVGSLQTLVDKDSKDRRIFLFGSRHSWVLDAKDVSEIREAVPGGCTYVQAYEKMENFNTV